MKFRFITCSIFSLFFILLMNAFVESDSKNVSGKGDSDQGITLSSPELPDLSKELTQKYQELHCEQVDVHYAVTTVLVSIMMAEKEHPQADVWYGGGGILPFEAAVDKDIIAQYVPESAEDWEVVEDGIKTKHEDDYYTGVEVFVLGFSYNTELVSEDEAPKS